MSLVTAAVIGSSCATLNFKAPDQVQGEIPVVIVNDTDAGICNFRMTPRGSSSGDNWTGAFIFDPGKSETVNLQKNVYSVFIEACDGEFDGEGTVAVDRRTELRISTKSQRPVTQPDFNRVTVTVRAGEGGGEEECTVSFCGGEFPPCCDGYVCTHVGGDTHKCEGE